MEWTMTLKHIFGLDPTPVGIGSDEQASHECTVCGTGFDSSDTICPQCGSQFFRRKTTTPNARFNLLFVIVTAGFAIIFNIVTGEYHRDGPVA